mgnify:CR=1 FL=1
MERKISDAAVIVNLNPSDLPLEVVPICPKDLVPVNRAGKCGLCGWTPAR